MKAGWTQPIGCKGVIEIDWGNGGTSTHPDQYPVLYGDRAPVVSINGLRFPEVRRCRVGDDGHVVIITKDSTGGVMFNEKHDGPAEETFYGFVQVQYLKD